MMDEQRQRIAELEAEAHWTREHAPKSVVLTDMVCVSVQVEGE